MMHIVVVYGRAVMMTGLFALWTQSHPRLDRLCWDSSSISRRASNHSVVKAILWSHFCFAPKLWSPFHRSSYYKCASSLMSGCFFLFFLSFFPRTCSLSRWERGHIVLRQNDLHQYKFCFTHHGLYSSLGIQKARRWRDCELLIGGCIPAGGVPMVDASSVGHTLQISIASATLFYYPSTSCTTKSPST